MYSNQLRGIYILSSDKASCVLLFALLFVCCWSKMQMRVQRLLILMYSRSSFTVIDHPGDLKNIFVTRASDLQELSVTEFSNRQM